MGKSGQGNAGTLHISMTPEDMADKAKYGVKIFQPGNIVN